MEALPRGTAQIVTANRGPSLPLLHYVNGEPTYTGPLGVARLFVRRDRYLVEVCKYGMKWGAFLAHDPEGNDVSQWAVSYVCAEDALRKALGYYFMNNDYDSTTLAADLRRLITNELDHLNEGATT